jgi:peptidoglycan/LPS O-acetylase OafA/YrhL
VAELTPARDERDGLAVAPVIDAATVRKVHRGNNFDFVRFVAASLVLFSHSYSLTGQGGDEPMAQLTHGSFTFGGLAVRVFFVISGFLVCQSWLRRPQVVPFVVARTLRIFPGYAVALAFTVLVGLAVTTLAPLDYLRSAETWNYFWNNLTMQIEFFLPGVFEQNAFARAVNGSIWSLRYEVRAYLVVLVLGAFALLQPGWTGVLGWFAAALYIWHAPWVWGIVVENDIPATHLCICFAGAAIIALNPFLLRHLPWIAVASGLALLVQLVAFRSGVALVPGATILWTEWNVDLFLLSGLLWFVHRPLPVIRDWARYGDFSYGVFIYAFPLQQLIAWSLKPDGRPYLMMALAFPATLVAAWLSWRLIEAPALALKGRLGDRLQAPIDRVRARFA